MVLLIIIILFINPFFALIRRFIVVFVRDALIDRLGVRGVGVLGLGC